VVITDEPTVLAVSRDTHHGFSKQRCPEILLLEGLGVQGDAHAGTTVQHLSHVKRDPTEPNLRQVHLIHAELLAELGEKDFDVEPGQLGENITTQNLDLLALPRGTALSIGSEAVLKVTGLRNPCAQINGLHPRLLDAVLGRDDDGQLVRKAGIMSVVVRGGPIRPGDRIEVRLPTGVQHALKRV
jgi:MOSC domain-containing protein YiiM